MQCKAASSSDLPCPRARRVAAHAAALLRDLEAFTPRCFARGRALAAASADGAPPSSSDAPGPPPFFFAAGCALEGASPRLPRHPRAIHPGCADALCRSLLSARAGGEGGAVIRLAAESADDAYAWARAALAPLHAQLGGAPYRL